VIDTDRTFAVASDAGLVELIQSATRRLIVVAPAVTDRVAAALAGRLRDLGRVAITVILDADPEVYRLGYGTQSAFDVLRTASKVNQLDLRMQAGVRIGVVISDDVTMLFAPVPMLIEAGSKTDEKPNAIIIKGGDIGRIADATGAGEVNSKKQEIGTRAMTPELAEALDRDLAMNPPQKFDVARALRVFSSKVQCVELEVANYRLSTRQVRLPPELMDITDDDLKKRISSRIRTPASEFGKFTIKVTTVTGTETLEIDEKWLSAERKRIEDDCTFPIPKFGRVILHQDREKFDREIARYREIVLAYQKVVVSELEKVKSSFEEKLVTEYLPRWIQKPPPALIRYLPDPTGADIKLHLRRTAQNLFAEAVDFAPPLVRVVYKNVAPESVQDKAFTEPLRREMEKREVPDNIIKNLFNTSDAAPTDTALKEL
jgi:hypothetical protein